LYYFTKKGKKVKGWRNVGRKGGKRGPNLSFYNESTHAITALIHS
jgi:hypothetical protein